MPSLWQPGNLQPENLQHHLTVYLKEKVSAGLGLVGLGLDWLD